MKLPVPDASFGPYPEDTTRYIRAAMVDEHDAPIPGSVLSSVTMTIRDEATGEIVNNRDHTDIIANVDESGLLERELTPADMAIVDDDVSVEIHRVLLEWSWQSVRQGKLLIRLGVNNHILSTTSATVTTPVD